MDANNVLGEVLEKGQNAASTAVSDVADSVSGQIGLKNETAAQVPQKTQSQTQQQPPEVAQNLIEESQRTKEMVRDFYSSSDDLSYNAQTAAATEEQQLASVRQKLHQELHSDVYYQPLISYEHKQQEERPAEKMERQQMEDLQIEQKKKQNELPIAVQRAQTHEMTPGIAG